MVSGEPSIRAVKRGREVDIQALFIEGMVFLLGPFQYETQVLDPMQGIAKIVSLIDAVRYRIGHEG
jgi:hypothetical protein